MNQLRMLCLLGLLIGGVLPAFTKEVIKVYTYHLKPPFVVREVTQEGLYFDALKRQHRDPAWKDVLAKYR